MTTGSDSLGTTRLEISGVTAALHLAAARTTVELFAPDGRLMLTATTNRLEPPGVRGVWTTATAPRRWALVVVGALGADAPLPLIRFTHRRRQVRGWLTRLGPFWLAEAAGPRLRVYVDDGLVGTSARSRRLPGPTAVRRTVGRHPHQILPAQETL